MSLKKIVNFRSGILSGIVLMSIVGITLAVTSTYNPNAYIHKNVKEYLGPSSSAAISFYPKYPVLTIKPGMNAKLIAKGEYLVKLGDCMACHTDTPNHGAPFAGGLAIDTPFGTFFTPNITPDKKSGIGNWTNADFINAMHDGINPNGSYYFPVFPYTSFTKVNKDDLVAIKAYLDALPPIYKVDKKPTAPWPFSWRFSQVFWRALFFKPQFYNYNPDETAQWNRGAYLVQGLGHCGECHTPRNFLGAMKNDAYLTGAFVNGFWAPNITHLGLETATTHQVVQVFKKEELIDNAGPVRGPMAEVDHDR